MNMNLDDVVKALMDTQRSIDDIKESPAINGGFTVLMNKIDALQESQNQLTMKVEAIHEAIYHPDEGIYARIKSSASVERVEKVENAVTVLNTWKEGEAKTVAAAATAAETVAVHDVKIKNLEEFKTSAVGILKKVGIGFIGAIVTLVIKLVYAVITSHVRFN